MTKKSEKSLCEWGGGGGGGGGGEGGGREELLLGAGVQGSELKTNVFAFFVRMLYIKFQVSSSRGSLVLT